MPITNHNGDYSINDISDNVGIVAMQIYVPKHYIEQKDLEEADGVSTGKYTIGLGQERMSFCLPNEDAVSMALTVVQDLLKSYNIRADEIGRIEVGSESNPDRSKSIKTHIVGLYPREWRSCSGADCLNACFGGTAAMLNSLNWIESREWNGKYALVVMTDVAEYDRDSPARPTGGAGAMALLLGRDAPIVVDRNRIVYCCEDVYDFYKPNASEYPVVDGALSIQCYLWALRECATNYILEETFDHVVMHTPYCKLIQKGCRVLEEVSGCSEWIAKADAGLKVCKQVGNMYTAALYGALASLLSQCTVGQKILAFSYGSGLISCMFHFEVRGSVEHIVQAMRLQSKLDDRLKCTVQEYDARSLGSLKRQVPNSYRLISDERGRRLYE